ncbi:sulfite exporter TauE/SafE family protein [Kamptonema cortianum]|uniref:Probable membrane transporter protein n=2 Tax=Geitlerinema TaxID=63132 RepID=A0ABT7LVQ7_9CYAN|nr:sulfite exporter TauE/SafE family protein [Geitlerinema calcuttense]MDI9638368.1 sulfite exporter TauE/SafE family protein [Geitlerinema splendidum]MDK3155789.1 sulfite exporter TauE/SafE family protein [Kamptonema cortianum]MDL5045643.1 sulfite exporter TauE/SafE family protein [Oscillatoria amoena NRMC-F 0135]MDL5056122.1 sulfite exporter TauE/SafE family protein [Geitlerinema calcuttense NRMC-F 0142]
MAGFLGALTGLGGGVVIVPLLTSVFGVDIRYAIGASLVSVIATSCAAASSYIRQGYTHLRLGMFLEVATTLGAIIGALLATVIPLKLLTLVLAIVLLYSAYLAQQPRSEEYSIASDNSIAHHLKLNGTYPTPDGMRAYQPYSVPFGFGLMSLAGVLSGLLGIGSGALKVLAMDQVMRLPFKVSTTTSSFTIGVTAAVSAGVYLARGYIDPGLSMPVMLGVFPGALLGAKALAGTNVSVLRVVFSLVLVVMSFKMVYNTLGGI